MSADWPWALFLLLISPAIGSFLGVLADRLPERRSILAPSACAACGARLGPGDMVPVLSALASRGRCRRCGAPIPGHLLRIEVAAFVAALAAVVWTGGRAEMWATAAVLWCLIALFYADLRHFLLPNPLTLALLVLGLALAAADPGRSLGEGALSAAIGFAAFQAVRWAYALWRGREGMGFGDVKLMAGIGAAVGWADLPWVALLAALMGLCVAAFEARRRGARPRGDAELPFGSFLTAAAAVFIFL